MLDIIFLSYDEPNANANFRKLKDRFPHTKRVHGVKGIAQAHFEAAKKANTAFFYVVDADAEILDSFDFSYIPPEYDAQYVHIWHAYNPATGLDYGYGGVKLFNKALFKDIKTQLDFSTSLAKGIKMMPEIACVTHFNSDHFRAYRGAFREAAKLFATVNNKSKPQNERDEARERLACWIEPVKACAFRNQVQMGARQGIYEAKIRSEDPNALMFINDHDLLIRLFTLKYPELDFNLDPRPQENNPMKHELFFTSRIASALYDPFVLDNLPVTELRDAMSDGQLLSKMWVIQELDRLIKSGDIALGEKQKLKTLIVGGWIGTLALLMNAWELPLAIVSNDIDTRSCRIAEKLNYDYDFKTIQDDMYSISYDEYDIVINTASEHIKNIREWRRLIPSGKIIIVQNNNYVDGEGHISTVDSAAELRSMLSLADVFYEGTRRFHQYDRYMLIGRT